MNLTGFYVYMELYQLINKRGTDYITDGKALVYKIARRKIAKHNHGNV